jgi:DNA-binding CsgD family transcriptional regulator
VDVPIASSLAVSVSRSSWRRPYQLLLAPLRHGLSLFAGLRSPQIVLLIIDPERRRPSAPDLLVGLYGLTRREAVLASTLSCGKTVEEAAHELQMSYETARSHLRRIFEKTNTSRQAELILLLARLPKPPS